MFVCNRRGAEKGVVLAIMQELLRRFSHLRTAVLMLVLLTGATCAQSVPPATEIDLATAPAALVMISDPGCPYCARWEREVAPGYVASDDSKIAPLVRRDRRAPDIAFIPRVVYSPTFVMLVRGREVGRIVGYAGADLFWMQLAALMEDVRIALRRSSAAEIYFAAHKSEGK